MNTPLQIAFHNMPPNDDIESTIRTNADWLEHFCDRIVSCHVVVDRPHLRHKEGNLHQVRIDVKVPGAELVVKRGPSQHLEHKDIDVTIREAFDELRRQLEDYIRSLRGHVKAHDPAPVARVNKLFAEAGYGFLETPDGREIYFHRNSVLHGEFDKLAIGTEVRFTEELGDKGPQASTVKPSGRHNHG